MFSAPLPGHLLYAPTFHFGSSKWIRETKYTKGEPTDKPQTGPRLLLVSSYVCARGSFKVFYIFSRPSIGPFPCCLVEEDKPSIDSSYVLNPSFDHDGQGFVIAMPATGGLYICHRREEMWGELGGSRYSQGGTRHRGLHAR